MNKYLLAGLALIILVALGSYLYFAHAPVASVISTVATTTSTATAVKTSQTPGVLASNADLHLSYVLPESWTLSPITSEDIQGSVLRSPDYLRSSTTPDSDAPELFLHGAAVTINKGPKNYLSPTVQNPLPYAHFEYSQQGHCSNCSNEQITFIDGIPAFRENLDFRGEGTDAKSIYIEFAHDGERYTISYDGATTSPETVQLFEAFLASIKITDAHEAVPPPSYRGSATIDFGASFPKTRRPVITGTVEHTSGLLIFLVPGVVKLPGQYTGPGSIANVVATVGGIFNIPGNHLTLNGSKWAAELIQPTAPELAPGRYTVGVYGDSYLLNSTEIVVQ